MDYWKSVDLETVIRGAASTILIVAGALITWLLLTRLISVLEKRYRVSNAVILPIRLVIRYGLILVVALFCLSAYGIPVGNFWTFVSTIVGLVAIGFVAVWSVLSNFSSTFLLLMLQPFRVGDYVKIVGDDVMGRVVDINVMFTTVRSLKGDVFTVPNNQFFQKATMKPADPEAIEAAFEEKDKEEEK